MVYNLDNGSHSVCSLYYHFVQVLKYRKKVFTNDTIVDFMNMKIRDLAEMFDVDLLKIVSDKDHFHMLFKSTLNIPKFINAVKTITSRELQRNFPEVKNELWNGKFWSPSNFLATSEQITLDVLKRYVDTQEVKHHENV